MVAPNKGPNYGLNSAQGRKGPLVLDDNFPRDGVSIKILPAWSPGNRIGPACPPRVVEGD